MQHDQDKPVIGMAARLNRVLLMHLRRKSSAGLRAKLRNAYWRGGRNALASVARTTGIDRYNLEAILSDVDHVEAMTVRDGGIVERVRGSSRRSLRNGNAATKKRRLRVAVPARVTFDIENEGRAGWSIVGQGYDEHENPTKTYKFLNATTKAAAIDQALKAAQRAVGDGGVTYDGAVVFVGGEKHSSFEREVFGARKGAMLFFEVDRAYTSAASSKIRGAWEITAVGQDKRGMDIAYYHDFPKKATQAEAIAVAIREATRMVNDGGQYVEAQIDTPDHDLITIKREQRAFAANGRRSSRGRR